MTGHKLLPAPNDEPVRLSREEAERYIAETRERATNTEPVEPAATPLLAAGCSVIGLEIARASDLSPRIVRRGPLGRWWRRALRG